MSAKIVLLVCGDRPPPSFEGVAHVVFERLAALPGLGEDTQLYEVAPETDAIVRAASYGARIVVRGDSLEEANGRAADALEAIAVLDAAARLTARSSGALVVIDLFCLDARPIEAAIARLRSDEEGAGMLIAIRPHHDEAGAVDLETHGLRKLGAREILVPAVPLAFVETVALFLNDVSRYGRRSRKVIAPGDAIAFGWVDVRAIAAESLDAFPDAAASCAPRFLRETLGEPADLPGMIVLCEPASDLRAAPLRAGVSRAAEIVIGMRASARQCGIERGIDVPRAEQTAVVSLRLAEGGAAHLRRLPRDEMSSSGWVAVAPGEEADDPAARFEVVPLATLVGWLPRLFGLLALPVGSGLSLGEDETLTIFLPDSPV